MTEPQAKFSISELMEAGFHFGHQTNRWNPKMNTYIYTSRNKIHVIDLRQTVRMLRDAYYFVKDVVSKGGKVLFVGTKRQAVDVVKEESLRCGQFYINHRWLGGTLTNWSTLQSSIQKLRHLEKILDEGANTKLTKKELLNLDRERVKLDRALSGIKNLNELPDVIVVTDTRKESLAIREANKLKIPVVALVDTNCDPDDVDWVIPGNDDAIRSLRLFCSKMAEAALEGRQVTGEEAHHPGMGGQRRRGPASRVEADEMVEVDG